MEKENRKRKILLIMAIVLFVVAALSIFCGVVMLVTKTDPEWGMDEARLVKAASKVLFTGLGCVVLGVLLLVIRKASEVRRRKRIEAAIGENNKSIAVKAKEECAEGGVVAKREKDRVETPVEETAREERLDSTPTPSDSDAEWEKRVALVLSMNTLPENAPKKAYARGGNATFSDAQKGRLKACLTDTILRTEWKCPICIQPLQTTCSETLRAYTSKSEVVGYEYWKETGEKIRDLYEDRPSFAGVATLSTCKCEKCGLVLRGVSSIPRDAISIAAKGYGSGKTETIFVNGKGVGIDTSLKLAYNLINYTRPQLNALREVLPLKNWDTNLR